MSLVQRTARIGETTTGITIESAEAGGWTVRIDGTAEAVHVGQIAPGVFRVVAGGHANVVHLVRTGEEWSAFVQGDTLRATLSADLDRRATTSALEHGRRLSSPMPARVVHVMVAAGSHVRRGDTLVVLEAMKMQLTIKAPMDATVAAVRCVAGELVAMDQVLVELD